MGRWNPLIGMGDDGLRSPARENQAGDLGEESYHLLETVAAGNAQQPRFSSWSGC